jgi:hypothetical protein
MNSSYSKEYRASWNTRKEKTVKDLKGIVWITLIREFYIIGVKLEGPKIGLLINLAETSFPLPDYLK